MTADPSKSFEAVLAARRDIEEAARTSYVRGSHWDALKAAEARCDLAYAEYYLARSLLAEARVSRESDEAAA